MIAIDYTPAHEQGGGIGRLVRELVAYLALVDTTTPYKLFVCGTQRSNLPFPPGHNFTWAATAISPSWLARIWHRLHLPLPVETFTGPIDLYHATDFVLPPVLRPTRSLLTVHDLSFIRVPETSTPALRRYLERVVPDSVRRATHVLADSEATRQDVIELYDVPEKHVTTLYSGVSSRFQEMHDSDIRQKYNIPATCTFVFSVGTIQPRKNYARLITAVAQLRHDGYDVHLVIAGGRGWLDSPIFEAIRSNRMEQYIHLIGFVADEDLPALYTEAIVTAFVSLYEGFGFPVLESMACGTPAITSNVSSLPEVAGDSAVMVDPHQVDAIIDGLKQLLDDSAYRSILREKGFQQVKKFSWDRSAQQLIEIYRQLVEGSHDSR